MNMLRRVSFSGIDQWTKPQELQAIYQRWPFVEFVYLLTDNRKAGNRYPLPVILKAYRRLGLPMALHVCGKLAHDLVRTGDWSEINGMLGDSMALFDRIQLNVIRTVHFSRELTFPEGKQIIIQLHEGTEAFFEHYCDHPQVQGFQDGSGGRGIECREWMEPMTEFFGYAGGIGPENAVEAVRAINKVCYVPFWIDMESSIRTNDKFDVKRCQQVLEALEQAGLTPEN
ncbi:MAG: hypothetical protein IJ343_12680 [Clostridia bacterium]|nr:hypothetical protein [Clostridia bacterium]